MNIQSIQYQDADQQSLRVTAADGSLLTVPWPCETWHYVSIQAWLDAGNEIAPAFTETELLTSTKTKAIQRINDAYSAEAQPLIKEYPEIEQQSWTEQNREARAYLAWHEDKQGEAPETPVLDNILAGRNGEDGSETLQELCLAVVENADRFTQFQQLTGRRQRLVKAVKAAKTVEDVDAINW